MQMELRKTFQFEAAHLLPHLPRSHKCRRLHGHSFKVEIAVYGRCDPKLGWLMDYADLSAAFQPLHAAAGNEFLGSGGSRLLAPLHPRAGAPIASLLLLLAAAPSNARLNLMPGCTSGFCKFCSLGQS